MVTEDKKELYAKICLEIMNNMLDKNNNIIIEDFEDKVGTILSILDDDNDIQFNWNQDHWGICGYNLPYNQKEEYLVKIYSEDKWKVELTLSSDVEFGCTKKG